MGGGGILGKSSECFRKYPEYKKNHQNEKDRLWKIPPEFRIFQLTEKKTSGTQGTQSTAPMYGHAQSTLLRFSLNFSKPSRRSTWGLYRSSSSPSLSSLTVGLLQLGFIECLCWFFGHNLLRESFFYGQFGRCHNRQCWKQYSKDMHMRRLPAQVNVEGFGLIQYIFSHFLVDLKE